MKFFVSEDIYEDRIKICKSCEYYFKPTGNCKRCGCFMSLKARLAPLSCPEKFWIKTTAVKDPNYIPEGLKQKLKDIQSGLIKGKFKNHDIKYQAIDLYNTLYNTNYYHGTNCGSCLSSIYQGLKNLYEKYK